MTQNEIACPLCKKTLTWNSKNLFRPFCSERCKMIDLGAWASERYRVGSEDAAHEEESINES